MKYRIKAPGKREYVLTTETRRGRECVVGGAWQRGRGVEGMPKSEFMNFMCQLLGKLAMSKGKG